MTQPPIVWILGTIIFGKTISTFAQNPVHLILENIIMMIFFFILQAKFLEWLKEIMTNIIEFWPWEFSHGDRKISSNLVSTGPARNSWLKFQHFINHSGILHPLEAHSFPSQPGTGIWQVQLSTRDYCWILQQEMHWRLWRFWYFL